MAEREVIEADLTWTGRRFDEGVRVAVDSDGRIAEVGCADEPTRRLSSRALLPGFVNAHSHAFQRGLRGRGEIFPHGQGSFWSWREAMYGLAASIDIEQVGHLSLLAFREMRRAGITTVGEFHYLHHQRWTEADWALDTAVLDAAAEAGIRIVLLNAFYRTGEIASPRRGAQRRFGSPSLDAYWEQMDRLKEAMGSPTQHLGAVAHSIRAVALDELIELREQARKRHLVLHMHVEEQPREIEVCVEHYRKTPMALLNEHLGIDPTFTAVHCTHTAEADLDEFQDAGGNVCLCPLTEANLGDGIANVPRMLRQAGHVCLGTDSNARICMTEEMRWLEYGQRLLLQGRGICADAEGLVGGVLMDCATTNGAKALGIRTGAIKPGYHADFVTLDLEAPTLVGWTKETLIESFILGTGNEAIAETCVGGAWQVAAGSGSPSL